MRGASQQRFRWWIWQFPVKYPVNCLFMMNRQIRKDLKQGIENLRSDAELLKCLLSAGKLWKANRTPIAAIDMMIEAIEISIEDACD